MHTTKNWPRHSHEVLGFHGEYQFLKCLERNPLGEVWKIKTSEGKGRLAQFLPPGDHEGAFQRLQFIHKHGGLVPFEIARRDNGQSFVVTDYHPRALDDYFQTCWKRGLPGIPRKELLAYMRKAAETLDALFEDFHVQHLGLQPKHLVLQGDSLLVAGFGLVQLLWLPTEQPIPLLNPRYSAPELIHNRIHSRCDQYSLALIYAEMLTGVHPWRTHTPPLDECYHLGLLSSGDREIIARALSPRSTDRFGNLIEMVTALEAAAAGPEAQAKRLETLSPIIAWPADIGAPPAVPGGEALDHFISELVLVASGPSRVQEFNKVRYRLEPGRQLEHRCAAQIYPGAAPLKLEGFRQQWRAELTHHDEQNLVFFVETSASVWQWLTGQKVGLEIQVQLAPDRGRRHEVQVVIRPFGCNRLQAVHLLEDKGPQILDCLRAHLLAQPEQRTQERLLCSQPLRICPVIGGMELAEPIDCLSKDVSAEGIGLFLPQPLAAPHIYISLPEVPELASYAGLAKVVRKQAIGDGWYEIGASFARRGG